MHVTCALKVEALQNKHRSHTVVSRSVAETTRITLVIFSVRVPMKRTNKTHTHTHIYLEYYRGRPSEKVLCVINVCVHLTAEFKNNTLNCELEIRSLHQSLTPFRPLFCDCYLGDSPSRK